MDNKISMLTYLNFRREFFDKKYPEQRFGQAFFNRYLTEIKDPDIFNMTDIKQCEHLILTTYVEVSR